MFQVYIQENSLWDISRMLLGTGKKKMCKMRLSVTGLNLNHVDDVDFLAITFNEMGFKKYFKLFTSIY